MLKTELDLKLQEVIQTFKERVEKLVAQKHLGVLRGNPATQLSLAAREALITPLADFIKMSEGSKALYDAYVDANVYKTSLCTAAQDNGVDAADLAFLIYRESVPVAALKVSRKLKKLREKYKK